MKVRDIMTSEGLATASLDTTLEEIAGMMRDENVGAIPVLDEDEALAGIITDRDIVVRAIAEGQDPAETTAEDILSEELHTIHQDADIEDAADLMARHKIRRLPVVEEGMIIGMISLGDISVKSEEDQASNVLEDVSEGVKQSDGGGRKESRSDIRGGGRSEVGTGTEGGSRGQTRGQENGGRNRGEEVSGGREAHGQNRQNQQTGNRTEVRGERQENRGWNQRPNQGQANRGTTARSGSTESVFPAGRRSSGEAVAAEETRYQNQNAGRNAQQGGTRAENANAARFRNQSRSQQSVANDIVNVEGEDEFEFQNAGGGNARQRANKEQPSARGRQNTSARGRESGQVRGEDARSQGVTNRTAGEERSRQQKVTPMRAEANNPGRNRNRKRAS